MRSSVKFVAVCVAFAFIPFLAVAEQIRLVHTITGAPLDLSLSPENGQDTTAVREFLKTGRNPYVGVESCFFEAEQIYLTACSGCHGRVGEGKLGPGLNDDYWTYTKNKTDKGLFETVYGGAQGMMGPHGSVRTMDEILLMNSWIRHMYKGPVEEAVWLTDEQKASFVPFDPENHEPETKKGECEIPAA